MNFPIPFRLSPVDEPVPYEVIDFHERCDALLRRCDVLSEQLDEHQKVLDAIDRKFQAL